MRLKRNFHNNSKVTWQKKCCHNLTRVANKASDHQLNHELQWQAAMTIHWLHELLMESVDNHMIAISPNFRQTTIQNLCPEFPLQSQKQQEDSVMMLASIQETANQKSIWVLNNPFTDVSLYLKSLVERMGCHHLLRAQGHIQNPLQKLGYYCHLLPASVLHSKPANKEHPVSTTWTYLPATKGVLTNSNDST